MLRNVDDVDNTCTACYRVASLSKSAQTVVEYLVTRNQSSNNSEYTAIHFGGIATVASYDSGAPWSHDVIGQHAYTQGKL